MIGEIFEQTVTQDVAHEDIYNNKQFDFISTESRYKEITQATDVADMKKTHKENSSEKQLL
jgi:hypothetical protein